MDAKLHKFLQKFQHLKIRLEEIKTATNDFKDNLIGVGGFGNVYKGELSHSKGRSMVAIKRLDPKSRQGTPEFLKEITMLSDYSHENLISLLGFCCEGGEMILVYEHASRGSLDRYLNSPHLTWSKRLMICLDVAKGLCYLHDPRETHRRLIHCDIKSANILLDDQWNAKVSDFGLSIIASANEEHSVIVTLAVGTHGYCDPEYAMTHTLTKESDVYSFGVVLFEVLCGRLCCKYSNGRIQQNLLHNWVESYKQKQLKDIIFKDPTIQQMHQNALKTLSHIAYRCLEESREDRPKMAEVVAELEKALDSQESDVYSFDGVSFEVLWGTQQNLLHNWVKSIIQKQLNDIIFKQKTLVGTWVESSKQKQLNDIIFKMTIQPMDQSALESFSDIACRCLVESRENRPKMAEDCRTSSEEYSEWMIQLIYKEITRTVEPRLKHSSNRELWRLLCGGVFLNGGNTVSREDHRQVKAPRTQNRKGKHKRNTYYG